MNRNRFTVWMIIIFPFLLLSWGRAGHQIVAGIAWAHLTPKAREGVTALLGNETMMGVSSYADEIRFDSFFLFTGVWHYMDVPPRESFGQFIGSVNTLSDSNIYHALLHYERALQDTSANRSIRNFALKMIIHLVGDAHQPLHVARSKDQGGNLIPVYFAGDSTNLHAVWDSRLIAHTKMTADQLIKNWDFASEQNRKAWQADSLITWLYESNRMSNLLYDELSTNQKLGEDYYTSHIEIVRQRIDQAGIRLAGVLNGIFDPTGTAN